MERHKSIRLRNFDYAGNATYFVTICTFRRAPCLGEVVDGLVIANSAGEIVEQEMLRSSVMRPGLVLHSFVVMPNHVHVLLTITPCAGTEPDLNTPTAVAAKRKVPGRSPKTLGSLIAGFKSASTRRYRELVGDPKAPLWQVGYYDHVVRNDHDFARICEYIANNPFTWHLDSENPGLGSER